MSTNMKKVINIMMAFALLVCGSSCSSKKEIKNMADGHEYVDLGLPSGTKWATYNVGASKPTEYGDYFAWGETKPKKKYNWTSYKWIDGSPFYIKKYCNQIELNCTVDFLIELQPSDDAATANWGTAWRMPTTDELKELKVGCDWNYVENFDSCGVNGLLGTSKLNGATIFLPAGGEFNEYSDSQQNGIGHDGYFWSSSISKVSFNSASYLYFVDNYINNDGSCYRYAGHSVRAVLR